jgi:hypothetical protein
MRKKWVAIGVIVGLIFLFLHSTPSLALRTHLVFMGYPKAAITSEIIEDDYHNKVDKERFNELNAKAYTLTEPPTERSTQGQLRNFLVKKVGFLHFAEYLGEL